MCSHPDLANAAEMSALLHMPIGTWRDLARRRRLPAYRIGRAIRWDVKEVLALLREED